MDSLSQDQSTNVTPQQDVSQPPQIFGNYAEDGSKIPPSLSSPIFSNDPNDYALDDGGDVNDPKRRRIARACDMCRKKKIKCDGKMPACSHCETYKTECVFTHTEKKRNPPKGAKYIEGLENRLGRMESLLRMSGLLNEDDEGRTDLGQLEQRLAQQASSTHGSPRMAQSQHSRAPSQHADSNHATSPRRSHDAQIPSPPPPPADPRSQSPRETREETDKPKTANQKPRGRSEVETLSDMMCSLVTNNVGETRYIGSSSGFSIFSPKGIQWVSEKTGDTSFQDMISSTSVDDNKWYHWRPEIFGDIFARRTFKALPPKEECLSLLKDYFENFNMMFPLFHEPTFMHLVDRQYTNDPYDGSGWWASLNVALAIAYRIRVMSNMAPGEEDSAGWAYFKNALAVHTELTLRNTDLLSVQALLGMALFMQGTPNPQPSFLLIAAAIRLAHSTGLHKRGSGFGLNAAEIEQRKRVFWIAYMLDKDICLRSGRPPTQDDDDWNVELPSEDPEDDVGNVPLADGKSKMNLFRLMCRFAVISSKVYNQLYSVKASRQTDGELLNTIGDLDRELEEWKDSIPLDFRPEHEIKSAHSSLVLHVVVLHFAYYNCLTTIHRMSVHHGYWTSRLSNYAIQGLNVRPLNPRVFSSAALCVSAARASINLIKYIPPGDYACVWLVLYYPVSALVTLFANILQNPQDARARSDLKLMHLVVDFLSQICLEETSGSIRRMYAVCHEFERIATVVLSRAEKDMTTRQKRKQEREREKTEIAQGHERIPAHLQNHSQSPNGFGNGQFTPSPNPQADGMNAATSGQFSSPNFSPFSPGLNGDMPINGMGMTADMSSWMPGYDPNNMNMANNSPLPENFGTSYSDTFMGPGINFGSFQQPFVPQDLWSMSMTYEWDMANMGNQMFDNGQGGDAQQ